MKQVGATGITVLRGVEDEKAYEAGMNNTTSARALATCLQAILNSQLFSEPSRKEMFEILLSQTSKSIGKGIHADEKGLKVASKDGWITEIHHDAAIIQEPDGKNNILVILTRGVKEETQGEKLVETLAADLWQTLHTQ
jgi:beta-lactamase class A